MKFYYNLQAQAQDDSLLEEELGVPAAEIKLSAVSLFLKYVDCRIWLQIILTNADGDIFYGEDGQPVADRVMLHGSF